MTVTSKEAQAELDRRKHNKAFKRGEPDAVKEGRKEAKVEEARQMGKIDLQIAARG